MRNNVIVIGEVFFMKLNFCKVLMVSFVFISSTSLCASPQVQRVRDVGVSIQNSKGWIYEFTFADQNKLRLKNDNSPYTFLMIDGNVISDLNLPVINGRSFVPLRFLSETLGMNVAWDNTAKIARISKGEVSVSVLASKNTNDIQLVKGSTYVSIRFLEKNFPLTVSYRPVTLDQSNPFSILLHPMVTVDSVEIKETLTKQQSVDLAKSELMIAYNNFLLNTSYNTNTAESQIILSTLKDRINNLTCINKISRYYVLDGPYITLVDAVTGSIYSKKDKINNSFIELVNTSDPEIFAIDYFIG